MSSLSDECYRFEPKDWLSNCLPNFDELRRQKCDICVKVDNKSFMAHRVVLSATIPYFHAMVANDWIESRQTEVEIKDTINTIDGSAMELWIEFVYTGRIKIRESNVQSLQTKVWNSAPPMFTKRRNFGVATLRGKIYVCGGCDGRVVLNTAEVFDPKTQKWELIAPMNERRQQLSLVANCGLLYAIGGIVSGSDDRHLNTVEVFGPDHNCWKVLGSMVALNCNVVAAVLSDE